MVELHALSMNMVLVYFVIAAYKMVLLAWRLPLALEMMDFIAGKHHRRVPAYTISLLTILIASLTWPVSLLHEGFRRFVRPVDKRELFAILDERINREE